MHSAVSGSSWYSLSLQNGGTDLWYQIMMWSWRFVTKVDDQADLVGFTAARCAQGAGRRERGGAGVSWGAGRWPMDGGVVYASEIRVWGCTQWIPATWSVKLWPLSACWCKLLSSSSGHKLLWNLGPTSSATLSVPLVCNLHEGVQNFCIKVLKLFKISPYVLFACFEQCQQNLFSLYTCTSIS